MRRTGPVLPADSVYLPSTRLIGAAHLQSALGVSKARIHRWRTCYGFPVSHRDGRDTWTFVDQVRAWLGEHGVTVIVR